METRPERNIPLFNGDCYGAWKFRIKTVLEELQLYSAIEGPPPQNPDDEWTAKNTAAKCTIVNFLGNAFLHHAEGSSTAKSIIDNLDKLYERRNLKAQVALRKQLSDLKLLPNDSLSQHFSRFDKLISELTSSGANIGEMDKICQLLATLPSCYDGVIGPLEKFYGDNFNLAFVKTYLLDQEAKMEMETVTRLKDTITEPANNTRRKPNNYNQYRNPQYPAFRMYCEFCGRNNHFIQYCRFYNAQNGNANAYQAHPPGTRNIFPAMFPLCTRKIPKRLKKKTLINNTKHLRLNNINPYSVPNVKMNWQIKEEPIVKPEPVEIKEEPVWVKQEPQWEDQPIKMEPGTGNSAQGTMYLNVEPGTESSTRGAMYVKVEPHTENSTQGTMYLNVEPGTESSTRGTMYVNVEPHTENSTQATMYVNVEPHTENSTQATMYVNMEPCTESSTQGTMYVNVEPGTESSTRGAMYVKVEPHTENSTQGTMYLNVEPGTESSTRGTMYVNVEPHTENSKQATMYVNVEPHTENSTQATMYVNMEPCTESSTQGTMYVNVEPGTESSTQGTMYLNEEPGTENSTQCTMYVNTEPHTESSMQGTAYLIPHREQFKNKMKKSKKRAPKRARRIAKLMMQAEKRTEVNGAGQQPITNSVQGS